MDLQLVTVLLSVVSLLGLAVVIKMLNDLKSELAFNKNKQTDNSPLQLQAYERLSLFADRTGLKNLVTRVNADTDTAASLHYALLEEVKTEYNYNVTQQVYVTPEVWSAVSRLKDQNIYIINQIAASLPPQATAMDLRKSILEYAMHDNAELNTVVLDAIQFEAKKLM